MRPVFGFVFLGKAFGLTFSISGGTDDVRAGGGGNATGKPLVSKAQFNSAQELIVGPGPSCPLTHPGALASGASAE